VTPASTRTSRNKMPRKAPKASRSERDIDTGTTAPERCRGIGSGRLNWNFGNALDDPEDSDFRVVASGRTFFLHQFVVKRRSNMFASILASGFEETVTREVVIDNFPPADVETALTWMYTNEAKLTADNLLGVLRVGDYMQLDGLVQHCGDAAKALVTVESVLGLYSAATTPAESAIRKACLDFWGHNTCDILHRPQFLELGVDALATLLAHGAANCTEDALFERTVEWMRTHGHDGDRRQETVTVPLTDEMRAGNEDSCVAVRLLSLIRIGELGPRCAIEAVELANRVSPCIPPALVEGLRHQLTRHADTAATRSCNDGTGPRSGVATFSEHDRNVIEALSSTDEDTELSPLAMQHGIDLLLSAAGPNLTDKMRVVETTWQRAAAGTVDLASGNEGLLFFPFLYCGRWRLFALDQRWNRCALNASMFQEASGHPHYDCRRAYECYAAFRRCLERASAPQKQMTSRRLGWRAQLGGQRPFPVEPNSSDTGTALLSLLAKLFDTTAPPPTRQQIRNRILGPPGSSPSSHDIELRVHRAAHSVLTKTDYTPNVASLSTSADVLNVAVTADFGVMSADRGLLFQQHLESFARLGMYRNTCRGGYTL
jgi:hypothetical protein